MEVTSRVSDLPGSLAAQATSSLFFTATGLLGYNKLTPHLHYEMCDVLQNAERLHWLLNLVPRNHFKTTCGTISYPLWRSFTSPNDTGLIITNTAGNAEKWLNTIIANWEENQLLRSAFPSLIPEKSNRWSTKTGFCVPRDSLWPEPTWTAAGWDTKTTGGHYDYIIFDDIVDEETYKSPELMGKMIEKFNQRINGMLRPPEDTRTVVVTMNHWSSIDVACDILENHPEFRVYYRQAIEGGKPILPEMYSLEGLMRRQQSDPYTFATQWMNNPIDAALAENRVTQLKYYKRGVDSLILTDTKGQTREVSLNALNIYGGIDLRHTLAATPYEKRSSRNAVIIGGVDADEHRYLLDEWAARSAPEELLNKILEFHVKWQPIRFGLEGFGFQAALAPLANIIWKNEKSRPRLEPLSKDTTKTKDARIRGALRVFAEEKGYVHKTQIAFIEEFTTFPAGKTKDVLDAWDSFMQVSHAPSDDAFVFEESEAYQKYKDGLRSSARI